MLAAVSGIYSCIDVPRPVILMAYLRHRSRAHVLLVWFILDAGLSVKAAPWRWRFVLKILSKGTSLPVQTLGVVPLLETFISDVGGVMVWW